MKNFILSLILSAAIFSTASATSVTPDSELAIVSSAKVEVSVLNVMQKDFFQVADYNSDMDALDFVTKDKINFIQIFNEKGELEYQLPVMSNKLKISMKMFTGESAYKIGFITKNNTTIQFTNLKIN